MPAATHLETWLTGGNGSAAGPRVAVLEDPRALPFLLRSGWAEELTTVFVGARDEFLMTPTTTAIPVPIAFRGSFAQPGGQIELDDGYLLNRLRYSAAEFGTIASPTELRVWDPHDYSAFLRDFDVAWQTGAFADYLTNPLTILAEAEALVGLPGSDRPDALKRLFVTKDGTVRVGPTGRPLGRSTDSPEAWSRAGIRWERGASVPGELTLGEALDNVERRDAVGDRPALARYLRVLRAHREIRRSGRQLSRISGFGGRLQADLPPGDRVDPVEFPVLARGGSHLWRISGSIGSSAQTVDMASPEEIAVLECEVVMEDPEERRAWILRHFGMTAEAYHLLRSALLPAPSGQVD